ncbi:E3 ubiquitin-protein ligase RNF146-B-like isoform X2 [Actinia tenebrosa]|uniref:E3 ubiquitin-protein ligase n=1 Tax=Actinia tenebrosa TaxID=6105 RepID=A0A6P8HDN8_ACTTE|nr:E3 ubiquitin-protein ligase RNF146-B-like isoform X2 [Actinia tenebrosa]
MAERIERSSPQEDSSSSTKNDLNESPNPQNGEENDVEEQLLQDVVEVDSHPDCPVCLQPASYPVKLPCGHIFCFLCIKGVALRSRKCAICRQAIAADFLDKPTLVKVSTKTELPSETSCQDETENDYLWYYEGRNGWWQYDDKTSREVEAAFKNGKRSCTLLIAGFLYLIDFENMFQMRRNEPGRRRRIKRDKRDVDSKGVAGIRLQPSKPTTSNKQDTSLSSPSSTTSDNPERNDNEISAERVANQNCETTRPDTSDGASFLSDDQGGASSTSGAKDSGSPSRDVDSK